MMSFLPFAVCGLDEQGNFVRPDFLCGEDKKISRLTSAAG
jgi:hypothetical protein